MKNISNVELIGIASEIQNLFLEEIRKLHYGANLIDELHANENAHSRILRMLIAYNGDNTYPIFASFLKLIKKHCHYANDLTVCSPQFSNEEARIDVLIKEFHSDRPYAVIIENKVCGAVDQEEQIQRYIEIVMQNVSPDNIYVIYLTKDREKHVSEVSLTEKAKMVLGVTNDSSGRYIPLNYKDDILPWLEREVLPNLPLKEELLASSIQLYIDYLKGMFNMRENELPILQLIYTKMRQELDIQTINDTISLYEKIEFLKTSVESILSEDIEKVLDKHLYDPLQYKFPKCHIYEKGTDITHFFFKMSVLNWNKCQIVFTWDSKGQYLGIGNLTLANPLDDSTRSKLGERLGEEKYTEWWPWYKYVNRLLPNTGSVSIWKDVESGDVLKFFDEWLSKILEYTKDIDM